MTKDATGDALRRIADDEVREAVATGDTAALEDLDLTEEERAMVVAAADDFPEVEGFGASLKLGDIGGISSGLKWPAGPFNKAATYAGIKIKY